MTLIVDFPSVPVSEPNDERLGLAEQLLVQQLDGGRAALPLLPAVASRALELANDSEATVAEFAQLVETDPPLAARFLSVSNSALYSRGQQILNVTQAVGRLGLFVSRDLIFQVVYASTLQGSTRFQAEMRCSFDRSVLAGLACRAACSVLELRVREAYLCGLLHDIGESRIYRLLAESQLGPARVELHEAQELVRRYHARAGAELATRWQLPMDIVLACRQHHAASRPDSEVLRVVRIGDLVVPCVELIGEGRGFEVPEEHLEVLELEPATFSQVVHACSELADRR